jgi:5-deoxy-glucuronate isomerase
MINSGVRRSLLIRGTKVQYGEIIHVTPNGTSWKYIDFRVVRLMGGQSISGQTDNSEVALVVIAGTINIASSAGSWNAVGERTDPFSGPPVAVYLSAATKYEIHAVNNAEVAICAAPAREVRKARLIAPALDSEYTRGTGNAQRHIRNILMGEDDASSLFLTEVITLPGNWSSYPPHKHDEDNPPSESQLEEVYYYRAKPAKGFAFQRIYTSNGDIDETITAHDGDAVLVPRGYHVCSAAPEYWIYYLNVLAGPKHVYHITFDPEHAWIKENWVW